MLTWIDLQYLAITGQTGTDFLHKDVHQNMDAVTMFLPITKWRWSIRNPDSIPQIIRRACKISLEEKAGAVHLGLPQDIAKMNSEILPIDTHHELSRSRPSRVLIEKADQDDYGCRDAFIAGRQRLYTRKRFRVHESVCRENGDLFYEYLYG